MNKKSTKVILRKLNTLLKELKVELNKWKDILHSWIGRVNILRWYCSPNQSSAILIRIPADCSVEIDKLLLKFSRDPE